MGKVNRRNFLKGLGCAAAVVTACSVPGKYLRPVTGAAANTFHRISRESEYGPWAAELYLNTAKWNSGQTVEGETVLYLPFGTRAAMEADGFIPERWICLVTAERLFDANGDLRLINGVGCATCLTPGGLAIEGGVQGALGSMGEKSFRAYLDVYVEAKRAEAHGDTNVVETVRFPFKYKLAEDIPAGTVRLRVDFGIGENRAGHVGHRHSLNGEGFARRQRDGWSGFFSAPIPVNMEPGKRRIPWVIMSRWGSNGQRGIVAEEDKGRFAMSPRHIAPADPIFPMEDSGGRKQEYEVIPDILAWKSDKHRQIEWASEAGWFSAELQMPSGKNLQFDNLSLIPGLDGTLAVSDMKRCRWRPEEYGEHVLILRGYCVDAWGNHYDGGGTYRFWIAERLTIATATFLGLALQAGRNYGAPIAMNPAFAGEVSIELQLYSASEKQRRKNFQCSGKSNESGVFGPAEGLKQFTLDEPGEYIARIRGKATDKKGRLWMASLTHAGVVVPPDTTIEARGKKIKIGRAYALRGETHSEGYVEKGLPPLPANGKYSRADLARFRFLDHINYPWFPLDVLLVASEGQGANKIEPVLTYVRKGETEDLKRGTLGIGYSELQFPQCEGGWDPFTHPEKIRQKGGYWYAAAPRPGFMSRFMVATNGVFAPYWPTSNTNFGGQAGASANGDMPGDIYRLLGGVVVPEKNGPPSYAGYLANAVILPAGSGNNRIISPGLEDLPGPDGKQGRFFLVAVRPGTVYGADARFTPFLQIDPVVQAQVRYELISPAGKIYRAEGIGNMEGYFFGRETWLLNEPGVWTYRIQAEFDGKPGRMPGLPSTGGWLFVTEKRNAMNAAKLDLGVPDKLPFDPAKGFKVQGVTTGKSVFLAAVVPGCVVGQWEIPVRTGRFEWQFDPGFIHERVPAYDIKHSASGRAQLGRIVHLTYFTRTLTGSWEWARIIVRGPVAFNGT